VCCRSVGLWFEGRDEADEKGNCAGEMLGRVIEVELVPDSVIGNPRSVKIFTALLKSVSILNFSWILRT
jgi:hypothetical protein